VAPGQVEAAGAPGREYFQGAGGEAGAADSAVRTTGVPAASLFVAEGLDGVEPGGLARGVKPEEHPDDGAEQEGEKD